jgi:hypothetical protein
VRRFVGHYSLDSAVPCAPPDSSLSRGLRGLATESQEFFRRYSGASFNQGLYRIHLIDHIDHWTANVVQAFPSFSKRITCFAFDWLGRHFALDHGRRVQGSALILMLEPGTGQALEIPATVEAFHDDELIEYPEECLAASFYRDWRATGGSAPSPTQCVGYSRPLFLGGEDAVGNLELTDMDVYWSICAQLLAKVRSLPDGTRLGDIDMTEGGRDVC